MRPSHTSARISCSRSPFRIHLAPTEPLGYVTCIQVLKGSSGDGASIIVVGSRAPTWTFRKLADDREGSGEVPKELVRLTVLGTSEQYDERNLHDAAVR